MEIQEIEITIDENGTTKLHIRGVKGQKCVDLTRSLEEILGNDIIERKMTPESKEPDSGLGQDDQLHLSN